IIFSNLIGFEENQIISILILYTLVIGTAIQQNWLFHGLQVMRYVTIINVVSRTISVIMIFILVKEPNDVYVYCALYAVTSLLSGALSALLVRYKLKIRFIKVKFKEIINELKEGWYTFTTSAMSKILSGIGITVLGLS